MYFQFCIFNPIKQLFDADMQPILGALVEPVELLFKRTEHRRQLDKIDGILIIMRQGSIPLLVFVFMVFQNVGLTSSFSLERSVRRGPVPPHEPPSRIEQLLDILLDVDSERNPEQPHKPGQPPKPGKPHQVQRAGPVPPHKPGQPSKPGQPHEPPSRIEQLLDILLDVDRERNSEQPHKPGQPPKPGKPHHPQRTGPLPPHKPGQPPRPGQPHQIEQLIGALRELRSELVRHVYFVD